jgi:Tfp pilus assembly protein PilF
VTDDDSRGRAKKLWEDAYRLQMQGDLDEAEALYRRSIDLFPTAEAHTFLGWTMTWRGDLDGAIAECHKAIAVDPDFGNPYNDIGAYLIQKCELDEAIPWLERAKKAPRYEPKHFPYLNLGRVYATQGLLAKALAELQRAVEIEPRDARAKRLVQKVRSLLN